MQPNGTDFLTEIIADKTRRLAIAQAEFPLPELRERAQEVRSKCTPKAFRKALETDCVNIIAEFKRASPSKGVIRADADPAQIAREYEAGGAVAVSVLTEESRFHGSLDDLRAVRAAVKVPVLRKDFVVDAYQIYETAAAGADAVLLIVAAPNDQGLGRLRRVAENELGLDALVEVHSRKELRRALTCGASLVGVNNRDLRTFTVSLEPSIELAQYFPSCLIAVSESGLRSAREITRLQAMGYKGFLIGESLMREDSPGEALRRLVRETEGSSW